MVFPITTTIPAACGIQVKMSSLVRVADIQYCTFVGIALFQAVATVTTRH